MRHAHGKLPTSDPRRRALRFLFLKTPPPPISTLFPYTTLFRSRVDDRDGGPWRVLEGAKRPVPGVVPLQVPGRRTARDRKSTRLNSSHRCISYAVFCLKKKNLSHERNQHRVAAATVSMTALRSS